MFKKIISILLCVALLQGLALTAFAAEARTTREGPDANSFFAFQPGPQRMESDGSFTFSFHSSLYAQSRFKPKGTEIDIWVSTWLRDIDKTPEWTDPWFPPKDETKTFTVSLYKQGKAGVAATFVDSFSACANDKKKTYTFSNLEAGEIYYLVFESTSTLGTRIRFDGKGKVSDVIVTTN